MKQNCPWIAWNLQLHHNSQEKTVPALPRFWVDCTLIPDRLRKDADSGAILGDVFLQFVDFPGFWCNPFDPLAILRGFAISSQFNWIVKIAAPMFWFRNPEAIALHLHSILNPRGCARLARSQRTKSTTIPRIAKDCASIARVLG